ncbi:MAG: hypothetical protein ACYC4N_31275, partial [Pirellulaceae bacterium]
EAKPREDRPAAVAVAVAAAVDAVVVAVVVVVADEIATAGNNRLDHTSSVQAFSAARTIQTRAAGRTPDPRSKI